MSKKVQVASAEKLFLKLLNRYIKLLAGFF